MRVKSAFIKSMVYFSTIEKFTVCIGGGGGGTRTRAPNITMQPMNGVVIHGL